MSLEEGGGRSRVPPDVRSPPACCLWLLAPFPPPRSHIGLPPGSEWPCSQRGPGVRWAQRVDCQRPVWLNGSGCGLAIPGPVQWPGNAGAPLFRCLESEGVAQARRGGLLDSLLGRSWRVFSPAPPPPPKPELHHETWAAGIPPEAVTVNAGGKRWGSPPSPGGCDPPPLAPEVSPSRLSCVWGREDVSKVPPTRCSLWHFRGPCPHSRSSLSRDAVTTTSAGTGGPGGSQPLRPAPPSKSQSQVVVY